MLVLTMDSPSPAAAGLNCVWMARLDGTHEDVVLEHERDSDKDKVQQEHGEAQSLVHAPIEAGDR